VALKRVLKVGENQAGLPAIPALGDTTELKIDVQALDCCDIDSSLVEKSLHPSET
jgi:hypothetical protein